MKSPVSSSTALDYDRSDEQAVQVKEPGVTYSSCWWLNAYETKTGCKYLFFRGFSYFAKSSYSPKPPLASYMENMSVVIKSA